jgi:hypothetical protein
VELVQQQAFGADPIENLQQQGQQQLLRTDGRPSRAYSLQKETLRSCWPRINAWQAAQFWQKGPGFSAKPYATNTPPLKAES